MKQSAFDGLVVALVVVLAGRRAADRRTGRDLAALGAGVAVPAVLALAHAVTLGLRRLVVRHDRPPEPDGLDHPRPVRPPVEPLLPLAAALRQGPRPARRPGRARADRGPPPRAPAPPPHLAARRAGAGSRSAGSTTRTTGCSWSRRCACSAPWASRRSPPARGAPRSLATAVVVGATLVVSLPVYLASSGTKVSEMTLDDRRVQLAKPIGRLIAGLTGPDDRVAAVWANAAVYWYADRTPGVPLPLARPAEPDPRRGRHAPEPPSPGRTRRPRSSSRPSPPSSTPTAR